MEFFTSSYAALFFALGAALLSGYLVKHDGKPIYIVLIVLILGIGIAFSNWQKEIKQAELDQSINAELQKSLNNAETNAKIQDRKIEELKVQLAKSDAKLGGITGQLSVVMIKLEKRSETASDLDEQLKGLIADKTSLTIVVKRLIDSSDAQSNILSEAQRQAAENARNWDAEEANRIRCQAFLGDEDFRRLNGC